MSEPEFEIRKREVLRYLGYGKNIPDENIGRLIDKCIAEVERQMQPKSVSRRYALKADGEFLEFAGMRVKSRSLERNLKGCTEVLLFAATLGNAVDRLLARYLKLDIAKAAIVQAAAAEAIEAYCNACQLRLKEELAEEGFYLRPRFSPGYGDLSLEIQPEFLEALRTAKTVGILLSEGGVMIPEKSVTAIIGISALNERCAPEGCEVCENKGCAYRR